MASLVSQFTLVGNNEASFSACGEKIMSDYKVEGNMK